MRKSSIWVWPNEKEQVKAALDHLLGHPSASETGFLPRPHLNPFHVVSVFARSLRLATCTIITERLARLKRNRAYSLLYPHYCADAGPAALSCAVPRTPAGGRSVCENTYAC